MAKPIEERTAEVILQKQRNVTVGEKTYIVPPPTLATLIRASEVISQMPTRKLDKEHIVEEALSVAKDCKGIALTAAVIILGAPRCDERAISYRRRLRGIIPSKRIEAEHTRAEQLADEIASTMTPSQIQELMASLLGQLQLADFFALTTFLTEINLTRPTKVERS